MLFQNQWKKTVDIIAGPLFENANPYDRDQTEHIRIAAIKGPWHPKMAGYLRRKAVPGLHLSRSSGFSCDSYDFLREMGHLELLSLQDPMPAGNSMPLPIGDLTALKRLATPFEHRQPVAFDALPDLLSCSVVWNTKIASLFDARGLRRLQMRSLNWKHADRLGQMTRLENLSLSHSGIRSFEPIAGLTNLTRLSLEVCPGLESIDGIDALQDLRLLNLSEVHKVTSLDCLADNKALEVLTISDAREIRSVAPLENLKNLKAIWIAGPKTNITDGDLTPLTKLPKLAMLSINNRSHYSHRAIKKWDWGNLDVPDEQLAPA